MDSLLDFMAVSKYGSSSGRAVGPTFKLGPTRICERLEYSRRSSIDNEISILFDMSNVAPWFQGLLVLGKSDSWQVSLLVDDGTKERRTVTDERTAMSMLKEFECQVRLPRCDR